MGADRIQSGAVSDPFDSPGSLVADPQSGGLSVVTKTNSLQLSQTALLALLSQTALTNISTAQNLFSQSIPGGQFNKVGRTFLVSIFGIYSFAGGSTPTITLALKLGSVTLFTITSSAINTAASTNLQFQLSVQCTVAAIGASATIESHGSLTINLSANTPGAALSAFADQNTAVSGAIDLTQAQNLVATIACSGTLSSAQLRSATVELVS